MIQKTILVTGSSGMLGATFIAMMSDSYVISEFSPGTNITDAGKVEKQLRAINPDIILHTAAYTDVNGCELDPQKAYSVNVEGTSNIVDYCLTSDTELIYISSTGVYGDHKHRPYLESDETLPTSIHHQTKLQAERLVESYLSKYLIIRVGWLYGGSISHKNNFVYRRFLDAKDETLIYSNTGQIGNPTSCHDVVNQICLLLEHNQDGIFNCVNDGDNVSRHCYVTEIIKNFELDCVVGTGNPDLFKRIAPVSANESAANNRLNSLGLNIMGPWKASLVRYITRVRSQL